MKKLLLVTITLLVSGGITIAQDKWQNTVSGSFGTSGNQRISAMHVFNGKIYAGTANSTGEVYRSSTGDANSWTSVFSPSFVTSIDAINSTVEGGGYIYVSGYAYGSDNPRISRSSDGQTWVPYYESSDRLPFVFPFKGSGAADSIYIVRDIYPSSIILKGAYDSNDPSNSTGTFDTVLNLGPLTSPYTYIKSYTQHNNRIYVGTSNAKIWMSSTDGNTWVDTLYQAGFGNSNNYSFTAMASFGGYLYVGTENSSDGAQIWRSNGSAWTKLNLTFPSGKITSLNVLNGQLWATFEGSSYISGRILKSTDGISFASSDTTGFGLSQNYGMAGATAWLGNHIYYSCGNMDSGMPQMPTRGSGGSDIFAGQIWRTCTGVPPTVNLGPDKLVCGGVAVTFDAGAGHTAYLWCTGETTQTISVTTAMQYSVTVTGSNGCQSSDIAELKNKPTPELYFTNPEGPPTLCKGDTLDITVDPITNLRDTLPNITRKKLVAVSDVIVTAYDTLVVSGINDYANVALVSVTIDSLDHPYDGELTISLKAPDGSYLTLASNAGSSGQNFRGTTFSRNGADIMVNSAPFTGEFKTYDPFNYIGSGPSDGQWVLGVYDGYSGNDGNLKGWSLKFSVKDTIMTYSWAPATGLSLTNKANVRAIGTSSITYTLTATNNIGCVAKDSVVITVPQMKVANSAVTACYGDSVQISATGGATYDWSPATGLTNTTSDSVYASPTVSITYYVVDTVAGCIISDSVKVKANSQVVANAGGTQSICLGSAKTINGSATGGTPAYAYIWDDGVSSSSLQNLTVSPTVNTTYSLTVIDADGCKGLDSAIVTINPLPTAGTSATQTVCSGASATITGTATGGSPAYTYSWNDGTSTYALQNVTVTPSVTTTYTLSISDASGCSATASTEVIVNPLPIANAGISKAICSGTGTTINGAASGGTPSYTYLWNDGTTTYALQNITVSPTVNTTYTLTVSDASSCTGEDTMIVTLNALPAANAGADQTICFSDTAVFTGSATAGTAPYTYSWNSGSSTYATSVIKVSPATTTTYTLTVTDNNGCSAADDVKLTITPSTTIYGHVNYSGGNLASGNVVLYKYLPFLTHFDTIQTFALNASGDYQFNGVAFGNYLVEVFANAVTYPDAVPTYYGNQALWNALPSEIVSHDCNDADTLDITIIEMPVLTGPGRLSGNVSKGPGFGNSPKRKVPPYYGERTDPIPGIDVKLGKKPGGSANIVGQTETDSNGDYTFTDLPLNAPGESYVVFVDIPGLGRDSSYTVTLTVTDSVILNLDYIADSTTIYIPPVSTGINNSVSNIPGNKWSVYPNPSGGNATVEYTLADKANVSLCLYNMLGEKMVELANGDQPVGTYKFNIYAKKNNLSPGLYFISLIVDGKANIQKFIITE